ncbi:hypothetical protein Dda_8862 [Drechslerella dactyloides]|uniref:Uncharacterized protein n=1 Tax=Drechslerella dactyloides TaxID=74499 RepID=A0AAD6ITY4_DREDA|nr:hypothetical protein Dda_8862 [Drechslerella dactyloides]
MFPQCTWAAMRLASMKRMNILCINLLVILAFAEPSCAFYRLWGYTDLQNNPPDPATLKSQAISLNRNARADLKALCHNFPDPHGTELGILRVAAFMNHGTNPLQAIGLWQEKDFNCGKAAPKLIIYLKPGFEVQAIDLRPFGGEWVYTNWKQIVPGTTDWITYVQPELSGNQNQGAGFVKRLTRDAEDHSIVTNAETIWDKEAPKTAWETDRKTSELARETAKKYFDNFFKTELKWIQDIDKTKPLAEERRKELQDALDVGKQDLQAQLQIYETKRNRNPRPTQNAQPQSSTRNQMSSIGPGSQPQAGQPYQVPFWGYQDPQTFRQQNPSARLGFGNMMVEDDTIQVKKLEDVPNVKQDDDSSIEEIIKKEEAVLQPNDERGGDTFGGQESEGMTLTMQDPMFGNLRQPFRPLILTPPPTSNMMNPIQLNIQNRILSNTNTDNLGGRSDPVQTSRQLQDLILSSSLGQQYQRMLQFQPILPSDWYRRTQAIHPFGSMGNIVPTNPKRLEQLGAPVLQPPYSDLPSLNTKRPLPQTNEPVFERGEEEQVIDSRKRFFSTNNRQNPAIVLNTPETKQDTLGQEPTGREFIQDFLRRVQDVDAKRMRIAVMRQQSDRDEAARRLRPNPGLSLAPESLSSPLPSQEDGGNPNIPLFQERFSENSGSPGNRPGY